MLKRIVTSFLVMLLLLAAVFTFAGHTLAQSNRELGPWYGLARLGETATSLHAQLGKPFMTLQKAGGEYEAYSIDHNRAWLVVYITTGRVAAYQAIAKNGERSALDDGTGISLGMSQTQLVSARGWGTSKDSPAPHIVAYPSSGGSFRFYGIDVNKRVERIGLSMGDTDMPPAIRFFAMSGWAIDRAYPIDVAKGTPEKQEDHYISAQGCGLGNHWRSLDRSPLLRGGRQYDQVRVGCGLTAFTQTMYFSLSGPVVHRQALKLAGLQMAPMSSGTTNTNVWILDLGYKGARIAPNGARVVGPGYPTVEYQINFSPTNPVVSVDLETATTGVGSPQVARRPIFI
jgi:hypothetical protein